MYGEYMYKVFVMILAVLGTVTIAGANNLPEDIVERIKKVGAVCLVGEPCADKGSVASTGTVTTTAEVGPSTYETYCAVCHNAGVGGAPLLSDQLAWQGRIDDKGIETIYANAIGGIGAMPAMGTCMTCSEDDIRVTIDYMFTQSGVN